MKKTNNPVAKYARDFNKAVVMKDRKKAEKKGDRKHKGKYQEDTDVVEDKKGLWDRIRANRKLGESVEQVDEGKIDKSSPIYKKYQELKKMPIKQLQNQVALINRGDDVKGYDKEGAVSEILRAKYGKRKVDKVFGFSEEVQVDVLSKRYVNLRKTLGESLSELTQADRDAMADRKKANLIRRGKAKAEPKAKRTYVGGARGEDDDHIIMQLRKAQDTGGKSEINVAKGKSIKLPKTMIDKLLKTHDKLRKPEEKKKFMTMLNHELRKKVGLTTKSKFDTDSDKAMAKFRATNKRAIPKMKKGDDDDGPSAADLRKMK